MTFVAQRVHKHHGSPENTLSGEFVDGNQINFLKGLHMIVDVRTYNIVPRKMATYLGLFEQYALPVQRKHIGDPLGYFLVEHGPLHQVVHLWGYENLADLETRRAARDADPAWADYLARTDGLVASQDNKLTRPTQWSGIR